MAEAARRKSGDAQAAPAARKQRALQRIAGDAQTNALDPLVHERARLGMLSALAVASPVSFNEMKALLQISDGNLSVHARKLEEAGYVSVTKRFEGRVPRTEYALTRAGRAALEAYLSHMEALIGALKRD